MTEATPTQYLASVLLEEPLDGFVQRLRSRGMSWQRVADQIANDTDGVIAVNRETLRQWYGVAEKVCGT